MRLLGGNEPRQLEKQSSGMGGSRAAPYSSQLQCRVIKCSGETDGSLARMWCMALQQDLGVPENATSELCLMIQSQRERRPLEARGAHPIGLVRLEPGPESHLSSAAF